MTNIIVVDLEGSGYIFYNKIKLVFINNNVTVTDGENYDIDTITLIVYQEIVNSILSFINSDYNRFFNKLINYDFFVHLDNLDQLSNEIVKQQILEAVREFAIALFFILKSKNVLDGNDYSLSIGNCDRTTLVLYKYSFEEF